MVAARAGGALAQNEDRRPQSERVVRRMTTAGRCRSPAGAHNAGVPAAAAAGSGGPRRGGAILPLSRRGPRSLPSRKVDRAERSDPDVTLPMRSLELARGAPAPAGLPEALSDRMRPRVADGYRSVSQAVRSLQSFRLPIPLRSGPSFDCSIFQHAPQHGVTN